MNTTHALILAIIQGITEFIPVSSSAHLAIIPKLFNWSYQGLDFDVVLHLGTLIAILFYFRHDLIKLANPLNPLTQKIILATIPTAIVALFIEPYAEQFLRGPVIIGAATIVFGLLLGFAQYKETNQILSLDTISYKYSFFIGLAQSAALIPGASRLGSTLTIALILGLSRKTALRFSFLLSVPIILLSSANIVRKIIADPNIVNLDYSYYFMGLAVSAIVGIITIHCAIKFIEKIGVLPFVIYRIILGCFLLYLFV
jgi:undecaprenyl-diphosphatase